MGGAFTAITVILQAAPVLLPGIGMAVSPFSTLPIAMAAGINVGLGIAVLAASVLLLLLISPQEAIILLFTTGLLGVFLGVFQERKGMLCSIVTSSVALTGGILALIYIAAIPSFEKLTKVFCFPAVTVLCFGFSILYAGIWSFCFRKFMKRLSKAKQIGSE